jgi:hypothetical protein
MSENILFITGHLAEPRLKAVLSSMEADFKWSVLDIGVKVAALMTEEIVLRRLPEAGAADKIMLPGRCRADLDRLSAHYGVPVVRGPDEVKDIPVFFGRARKASDMSKYDIQIFAEIIDATTMSIEEILETAAVSASRRHGTGPQDIRLQGQHRFRRPGRASARRQSRRRLFAQSR